MDGAIARTEQSGDDSALTDGLTRREHDILAFERQWWKYAGSKEDAIKELFSMSATRYYQVLNALVDRPEALAADPMLVKTAATAAGQQAEGTRGAPAGLRRHLSRFRARQGVLVPLDTVGAMNQRNSSGLPLRAMVMVLLFLGVVFLLVGFQAMGSAATTRATSRRRSPRPPSPPPRRRVRRRLPRLQGLKCGCTTSRRSTAPRRARPTGCATRGWNVTETGNLSLPDVTATTVYFSDAPGEREAADEVGKLLGGAGQPRVPELAEQPPGVVVVVTG